MRGQGSHGERSQLGWALSFSSDGANYIATTREVFGAFGHWK